MNTEETTDKKGRKLSIDPKYAEPYPQGFYRFWPWHVFKVALVAAVVIGGIVYLATVYQVPTDPNMPPLPDDGEFIPSPEWYLFFLFQPFWYLTGENAYLRPLATFWLPLLVVVGVIVLPLVYGKKRGSGQRSKILKRLVIGLAAWVVWGIGMAAVVGSGYPAKTLGCTSCHNPMMGVRQALPPANMGKFYRENRQRQIDVGRYRIGDSKGVGDSYKDANWQLRHFYAPTMTW
jgi:hypothetical protein